MTTNHIQATHDTFKSWCGETLSTTLFYFKDAEHAAINGHINGRLDPCPQCVEKLVQCLKYKTENNQ